MMQKRQETEVTEIGKYACHHGVAMNAPISSILPYYSLFAPRVKFSQKTHSANILLREIFSREPFIIYK